MGKSCSKPAAPALEPSAEPEAPLEPEPEPEPAPEPASYGATAAEDVVVKAAPGASTHHVEESEAGCLDDCMRRDHGGRGVTTHCCALCIEDVCWSREEAHNMILQYCYPSSISSLSLDEQFEHPCVRLNPLYWAMLLAALPCVASGKWVHSLWGQGGPVRDDEMQEEKEARVQWIYCTDGPMAFILLCDLFSVAVDAVDGALGANSTTLELAMSVGVVLCYIVGNSFLYDGMARRNATEVRIVIVCNGVFACGLATMLVMSALTVTRTSDWSAWTDATFAIRAGVVLFMFLATVVYAKLWYAYNDKDHEASVRPQDLCPMVFAASGVWVLLFLAFFVNGKLLWEALS